MLFQTHFVFFKIIQIKRKLGAYQEWVCGSELRKGLFIFLSVSFNMRQTLRWCWFPLWITLCRLNLNITVTEFHTSEIFCNFQVLLRDSQDLILSHLFFDLHKNKIAKSFFMQLFPAKNFTIQFQ